MRLPVTFQLHRSRWLALSLAVAHVLTAIGLMIAELPWPVQWLLWSALAISLARALRPGSVVALTLKADGCLGLVNLDGSVDDCRVSTATTVFSWLVVLRLDCNMQSVTIALPIDALRSDAHRQLRLWLSWKANTGVTV